MAVGQAVPANGGLVGGMPASFGGDAQAIRDLRERLAQVASERGLLSWFGPPTNSGAEGTTAAPRYRNDRYFDRDGQTLYCYQQTSVDSGEWLPVASGRDSLNGGIESPEVKTYPLITYNDIPRKIEALHLSKGTASLLVNGGAATPGTTVMQLGDRLSLSVTDKGTGNEPLGFTVWFTLASQPQED